MNYFVQNKNYREFSEYLKLLKALLNFARNDLAINVSTVASSSFSLELLLILSTIVF